MHPLLHIDGAQGEGGGQVLRTSLSLAVATARPIHLTHIRAGRAKPGLRRQHLTAVRAAAAVCGGELEGDELGAQELRFRPGGVRGGDYHFDVGSAGSTMLVLQTVLLPLLLADRPSRVRLEGGTHNPSAPPLEFLAHAFLPQLARIGARVELELLRPGFVPAGGGLAEARIEPVSRPRPLELLERGAPREPACEILLAHLPEHIAEREWRAVRQVLSWPDARRCDRACPESAGPGNVVSLRLRFAHVTEVVSAFGQRGVKAEAVGRRAAEEARRYLAADVPVGEHLADQLLLPLALLAGGTFRTFAPTRHTRTNAEVLRAFLGDAVTLEERGSDDWLVSVAAADRTSGD